MTEEIRYYHMIPKSPSGEDVIIGFDGIEMSALKSPIKDLESLGIKVAGNEIYAPRYNYKIIDQTQANFLADQQRKIGFSRAFNESSWELEYY